MSPLFCVNCREPLYEPATENGVCPRCGLRMFTLDKYDMSREMEFDLMLTALLYGKKQ